MVEIEAIPQETKERIKQIGAADLVIGIPCAGVREQIGTLLETLRMAFTNPSPPRTVLVHRAGLSPEDASSTGRAGADGYLRLMPCPAFGEGQHPALSAGQTEVSRVLFAISKSLGARACALLSSNLEVFTENRLLRLLRPVMELDFDLVVPWYSRRPLDGLLNSSIIYPLIRALYGRRIRWPAASDFAFSARLIERYLRPEAPLFAASRRGQLIWLVTTAICEGFEVCQVRVKAWTHTAKEVPDLSSVLAQIVGPVFTDIERTASIWQRVRGSEPVRIFGAERDVPDEVAAVNVQSMLESFHSGFQNLQEVWSLILPPVTLLELKKLARQSPDRFRLSDELWARIVYDFALGHRLRVINRDHLLRAITPLYLAWVASYALEVQTANTSMVERRVEQLCMAYEAQKPYLLSRWRWPDRFGS